MVHDLGRHGAEQTIDAAVAVRTDRDQVDIELLRDAADAVPGCGKPWDQLLDHRRRTLCGESLEVGPRVGDQEYSPVVEL